MKISALINFVVIVVGARLVDWNVNLLKCQKMAAVFILVDDLKQTRKAVYNVIFGRAGVTIVVLQKKYVLRILSLCL